MAGAMFESRGRSYSTFVGTVLNVICVLLVFQMVLFVPALFLPLITLISQVVGMILIPFGERRGHWTRRAIRKRPDSLGGRSARARSRPRTGAARRSIRRSAGRGPAASWRLRHMMYVVAGGGDFVLARVLAFDSAMIGMLLILGGLVFLFAAVIGAALSWLVPGRLARMPCCRCWRSPRNTGCRWSKPSWHSPISIAAVLTAKSQTWPRGSPVAPVFPTRSSNRANWSRATRSCWRGSVTMPAVWRRPCEWPRRADQSSCPSGRRSVRGFPTSSGCCWSCRRSRRLSCILSYQNLRLFSAILNCRCLRSRFSSSIHRIFSSGMA